MVWSQARDLEMLKEVATGGFVQRMSSGEPGTAWQNVAKFLNGVNGFCVTPRAIRDKHSNPAKKPRSQSCGENLRRVQVDIMGK